MRKRERPTCSHLQISLNALDAPSITTDIVGVVRHMHLSCFHTTFERKTLSVEAGNRFHQLLDELTAPTFNVLTLYVVKELYLLYAIVRASAFITRPREVPNFSAVSPMLLAVEK